MHGSKTADRSAKASKCSSSATRGALFNVAVAADAAFARIESELSGYYLLGVESEPSTGTESAPGPR